jgi:hypothetical protein
MHEWGLRQSWTPDYSPIGGQGRGLDNVTAASITAAWMLTATALHKWMQKKHCYQEEAPGEWKDRASTLSKTAVCGQKAA